jgi:hypothetical protein
LNSVADRQKESCNNAKYGLPLFFCLLTVNCPLSAVSCYTAGWLAGHALLTTAQHFVLLLGLQAPPIADLMAGAKAAHADVIAIQRADRNAG